MYFSIWFQIYGQAPGMFVKTRLFVFFYPPMVLSAASGLVWAADRCVFQYKAVVAAILCGIIISWSIFYYGHYPLGLDQYTLEMRLVDQIRETVTAQDMAVTCHPQTFTGALPSLMTTDSLWFLQKPLWRASAFQKARKVYLIEDMVAQRDCQGIDSLIKEKGRGVLVKQWTQGDARYALYSLSKF
jgi:hypothetical protein